VRRVETDAGDAGVAGAITGGVLGAILGNQIAHGDARGFARVVGAVGGAMAGREFGRSQSHAFRYDVLLRRSDGSSQVYSYDHVPPLRAGDTVRLSALPQAQASRAPSPYGVD
jgi:outer membrane lipoprotein SlyB